MSNHASITPSSGPVCRLFWFFEGVFAHGWLPLPNATPHWRKTLMSAQIHHLSERRLFVTSDCNVATHTCVQGPAWDGGEQIAFGGCANPEPGATGTATPQSTCHTVEPLGHAANAAYLLPCSTPYASFSLIVPGYDSPCQTGAPDLKKKDHNKDSRRVPGAHVSSNIRVGTRSN